MYKKHIPFIYISCGRTLLICQVSSINYARIKCFFKTGPLATRAVARGEAGAGASQSDSAWVNRYRKAIQQINPNNQVINLGVGGFTSYRIMPDNHQPNPGRPLPNTAENITKALTYNPDAIIINLPSNDIASGFPITEQIFTT